MRASRLLDRGDEVLVIYGEKKVTNSRRETTIAWDPDNYQTIKVTVVTDRQADAEVVGQLSVKNLRVMTRKPIPGSWARVKFRGEWWDLREPPTESHGISRATRHWEFAIRSRNELV
jgi:hypothetical protein